MIDINDDKKPQIRKERPIEDTLLYKQTMDFQREVSGILQNMNIRLLPLYGIPMNDALRIALANYRLCYLEGTKNYNEKAAFMRVCVENFAQAEIVFNQWFAVGIISKKTYCRLAVMVGAILEGSKRFYEAQKKRREQQETPLEETDNK